MVEGNLNFILGLSSGNAFSDMQIIFMFHIAKKRNVNSRRKVVFHEDNESTKYNEDSYPLL